jgi:hypothetical protein
VPSAFKVEISVLILALSKNAPELVPSATKVIVAYAVPAGETELITYVCAGDQLIFITLLA